MSVWEKKSVTKVRWGENKTETKRGICAEQKENELFPEKVGEVLWKRMFKREA